MEFQFIRDTHIGVRVKMSDEHTLIARWLNDETSESQLTELLERSRVMTKHTPPIVYAGNEIRFTLNREEALFEAHALFQGNDDINNYADDALQLDEHGLVAGCGFEDFVEFLDAWHEFIVKR